MNLVVTAVSDGAWLDWGVGKKRAAIGPGGIAVKGGEGDGITPRGSFPIREVFYRADRVKNLQIALPLWKIAKDDGWCDAPDDPNYNRLVKLPYPASAETLWREDAAYDLIVPLGYNDAPVIACAGSAIFLHVARADFRPTEGCVALALADLLTMLSEADGESQIIVEAG